MWQSVASESSVIYRRVVVHVVAKRKEIASYAMQFSVDERVVLNSYKLTTVQLVDNAGKLI